MLSISKKQSENKAYISGLVNDIDIVEGTSASGKNYVRGTIQIKVTQEVNGEQVENIVPVKIFTMRNKKDGTRNNLYDTIVEYKEKFVSVASCDNEKDATSVTVSAGSIKENTYPDRNGQIRTSWDIETPYINIKRSTDKEAATFELTGVVAKLKPEEKQGEETGRLLVYLAVVQYGGRVDVVELVAEGSKRDFIEANWNVNDTVKVVGYVNMSYQEITVKEELGFGEPIERKKTTSKKELWISGGSASGFDEDRAYDVDEITVALKERVARNKALENKPKPAPKKAVIGSEDDFDF